MQAKATILQLRLPNPSLWLRCRLGLLRRTYSRGNRNSVRTHLVLPHACLCRCLKELYMKVSEVLNYFFAPILLNLFIMIVSVARSNRSPNAPQWHSSSVSYFSSSDVTASVSFYRLLVHHILLCLFVGTF